MRFRRWDPNMCPGGRSGICDHFGRRISLSLSTMTCRGRSRVSPYFHTSSRTIAAALGMRPQIAVPLIPDEKQLVPGKLTSSRSRHRSHPLHSSNRHHHHRHEEVHPVRVAPVRRDRLGEAVAWQGYAVVTRRSDQCLAKPKISDLGKRKGKGLF